MSVLEYIGRQHTLTGTGICNTLHTSQPAYVKLGVASCLFHRARTITTGENIEREEEST